LTVWQQTYLLFGMGTLGSSLLSAAPIVTMLVLLGLFRRPAWIASLSGLFVTFCVATLAYRMPLPMAVAAASNGAAFGIFPICWVIFWAIVLFRITVDTGNFEVIKDSIELLTTDPRLQALLVAFAFGGFLEGAAGFGTPVAIAACMLIGLGFSPYSASAICLLTNTAPVAFGSLGIPLLTLAGTTGLPLGKLSSLTALICAPLAIATPIYMLAAVGGFKVLRGVVVPTLLSGLLFAISQFLIATYFGPQLADILAAVIVMSAIVAYTKWKDSVTTSGPIDPLVLKRFSRLGADDSIDTVHPVAARIIPQYSASTVMRAWSPYALLIVCILVWGAHSVQALLTKATLVFGWPYLNDLVIRMPPVTSVPTPYHAAFTFNMLAASGTACMVAALLSALLLRMTPSQFGRTLMGVVRQLRFPVLTISSVLAIAFLMNYAGATATLGLALAKTGKIFPFFSIMLGWLGVFLTGSDTSANAIFGTLQVITAKSVGVSPALMAAANSSGGTLGKMISLQTIAIAAAATGLSTLEQAKLFRFTLRHSVILLLVGGLIVLAYTYVFHLG
jgi:L-lactate transport